MATHNDTFACKVNLWDQTVGYLVDHQGQISFSYDKRFLQTGLQISPIFLPLREGPFTNPQTNETFQGLPGVFADSLPDYYGRRVMKLYFESKYGKGHRFVSPIQQLTYIGSRGLGALSYEPQDQPKVYSESLELAFMVEQAKKIMEGDFEVNASSIINSIMQSNSVAGGARPKALIGWNQATNKIIAGAPPMPDGYEQWLIKFDATNGQSEPYGRAEYVYSMIARECGIQMAETKLVHERGNAHFLTKRFDRHDMETKHMHSLCGMTQVDFMQKQGMDYEEFFNVVQLVTRDHREVEQAFRRLVFNFVGRNQDDHTKNFSFLMDKSGVWKLSPAYDLSYSYKPDSEWVSQHLMTINGQAQNPTKKDLAILAKDFGIKNSQDIIEQVEQAFSHWPQYAHEIHVDPDFIKLVSSNLRMSPNIAIQSYFEHKDESERQSDNLNESSPTF